jgi:hypothetical protein
MRIKYLLAVFFLASCTLAGPKVPDTEANSEWCDESFQYCVTPSGRFLGRDWTNNWTGLSGNATAHTVSNGYQPDHPNYVQIDFYHLSPSLHCKEIGVSNPEMKEQDGIQIVRGKVDFPSDYSLTELQPDCRVYRPYTTSYILCSEKNDVQVAICIHQVTDDPALAHSILDTFRWSPQE